MQAVNLRFINISFSYTPSSENIILSLNLHFSKGWTGIVGPNGTGKSTLFTHIFSQLSLPSDIVICIPQEIEEQDWQKIHHDLKSLDSTRLGDLLTVVHRLGSEPDRMLLSGSPSPGREAQDNARSRAA